MKEEWLRQDPSIPERVGSLKNQYGKLYGDPSEVTVVCAPGRAEILGNHTDYNEGYTISANVVSNLLILGTSREDNLVKIQSTNVDGPVVSFTIGSEDELMQQKVAQDSQDRWANYVKAVVWSFIKQGYTVKGFQAVIDSTIPLVGGVSSSAALELATAHLITALNGHTIEAEKLVTMCRNAENQYMGAPTGYLDQATVALADSCWLFISYRPEGDKPFTWKTIDMDIQKKGYSLLVGYDPESKHALVDGKYAKRREVCEKSLPVLSTLIGKEIRALRDVSSKEFESVRDVFTKEMGETAANYVTHVVYDDERVLKAVEALKQQDVIAFGKLLTASGNSSLNLYELDEESPELRFVYETVVQYASEWGVLGIRNMGGGFNATTLSLVKTDKLEEYKNSLNTYYQEKFDRQYHFLEFTPSPAAGEIAVLK